MKLPILFLFLKTAVILTAAPSTSSKQVIPEVTSRKEASSLHSEEQCKSPLTLDGETDSELVSEKIERLLQFAQLLEDRGDISSKD